MVGIQLYSHLPDIVVDTTETGTDGVVVALPLIEIDTAEMSGINCSMAPQQQASTFLIPLLDKWCSSLYNLWHSKYFTFANTFEVAQPEQNTVWIDIVGALYIAEVNVLSGWIGLVQPQPSRSLIIVTILYQLLRCCINAQEANSGLTNTER